MGAGVHVWRLPVGLCAQAWMRKMEPLGALFTSSRYPAKHHTRADGGASDMRPGGIKRLKDGHSRHHDYPKAMHSHADMECRYRSTAQRFSTQRTHRRSRARWSCCRSSGTSSPPGPRPCRWARGCPCANAAHRFRTPLYRTSRGAPVWANTHAHTDTRASTGIQ